MYLVEIFGSWGILIVMMPICIGYAIGLRHFEKLEKTNDAIQETQYDRVYNV